MKLQELILTAQEKRDDFESLAKIEEATLEQVSTVYDELMALEAQINVEIERIQYIQSSSVQDTMYLFDITPDDE